MKTRTHRVVVLTAVVLLLAAGQAGADILYSTLGPGDSYDVQTRLALGDPGSWDQGYKFLFGGSQSYSLDAIEVAIGQYFHEGEPVGANELDLWLMSDDGGRPGSIIEAFNFQGQMADFSQWHPLLVATSVSRPILDPGTPYWLVASTPHDGTIAAWHSSEPMAFGLAYAWRSGTGDWEYYGSGTDWYIHEGPVQMAAFRVTGSVVPLPGAVVLGCLGIGMAGGWIRKRRDL